MAEKTLDGLLAECRRVATDPKSQFERYLEEGRHVVLTAPEYTPDELIHAMGMVPFGAWGADVQLDAAKQYFPAFLCSVVQSAVELGMRGTYEGATAIVVPYLCDSLKVLGENWKYAVPSIPFIPMPYPQNRKTDAGIAFTKAGYERIARDLERLTGATLTDEALAGSIEAYNAHNEAMRRFSLAAAESPAISPVERSAVFKSAYFMDVEEHTALVEDLLAALEAEAGQPRAALRIVTSGIVADHPQLLAIMADNGFAVVADDVAAESRQYLVDAPEAADALDALSRKFAAMGNCSLLYDKDKLRVGRIVEAAQSQDADGVLVVLTKFCDPEEFDIPFITNACDEAGIPSLVVEYDRQMSDLSQINTAVLAFKELLESKKGEKR